VSGPHGRFGPAGRCDRHGGINQMAAIGHGEPDAAVSHRLGARATFRPMRPPNTLTIRPRGPLLPPHPGPLIFFVPIYITPTLRPPHSRRSPPATAPAIRPCPPPPRTGPHRGHGDPHPPPGRPSRPFPPPPFSYPVPPNHPAPAYYASRRVIPHDIMTLSPARFPLRHQLLTQPPLCLPGRLVWPPRGLAGSPTFLRHPPPTSYNSPPCPGHCARPLTWTPPHPTQPRAPRSDLRSCLTPVRPGSLAPTGAAPGNLPVWIYSPIIFIARRRHP